VGGLSRPRLFGSAIVNKILAAAIAAFLFAGTALAADAGPASMTFETKNGKVAFPHKSHQDIAKGDCKACHADAKGGKIAGWSKDVAHGLCKKCHETEKKGPVKCADCHKKG
jgi:predicted CXXCH cytochrome family protein